MDLLGMIDNTFLTNSQHRNMIHHANFTTDFLTVKFVIFFHNGLIVNHVIKNEVKHLINFCYTTLLHHSSDTFTTF